MALMLLAAEGSPLGTGRVALPYATYRGANLEQINSHSPQADLTLACNPRRWQGSVFRKMLSACGEADRA